VIVAGLLIAQRFEILAEAGSGGMGTVFRARDQSTGSLVAVKLVSPGRAAHGDVERFSREARVLAELRHPGIVSYVSHGQAPDGASYLAMEWLDGEDLSQRLARGALSIRESLILLRGVTDALGSAHRRGIIHRDLKPGNLFLRGGEVERVTLLDFGIAHHRQTAHHMTRTGTLIGTPEYMAPEQARGERNLAPAADVFALGCVAYACLTGRPPFVADHVAALLAKILFEEPPSIQRLVPEIPEAMESLLGRMLAKDPEQRPRDASIVHAAVLSLLESGLASTQASVSSVPATQLRLTGSEQELVSVLLASPRTTEKAASLPSPVSPEPVAAPELYQAELSDELVRFGMQAEWLSDGSLVATLLRAGNATDQAARAARAALELHERWPEAAVAMATGRGVVHGRLPVGEVIDRAAWLLTHVPGDADTIVLDEVSAALLDSHFVLTPTAEAECWRLVREQSTTIDSRILIGKPTPCVGREPELGMLEALLSGCRDESSACAVLIKAPQGFGKSRLLYEFVRRIKSRSEDVGIWSGRGDAMNAGSPYGILAAAIHNLCGLAGAASLDEQQRLLAERLGRHLEPADRERVVEFLGEICGVPFPDHESAYLRVARNDPKLMGRAIGLAFLDLLRAECAQHPVLLALDNLQWGDILSIGLVEMALRELSDQPFLVIALGRPVLNTLFPNLWADKVQEISLSGLSKKASERLIHDVLGKQVPAATVLRIVAQAAGNALYLEELIRAEAGGRGERIPETILAMLQSQLSGLAAGARRLLRAASVFGETFWRGGVRLLLHGYRPQPGPLRLLPGGPERSLLGTAEGTLPKAYPAVAPEQDIEIDDWLNILVESEIIERRRESRFPADIEYGFRHGLLREAAYSLLTAADQKLAHRLVGTFLEAAGQLVSDPLEIGAHYQRGGDPDRAALVYLYAAEQAVIKSEFGEALERADRGIACLPLPPGSPSKASPSFSHTQAELLGSLRAVQALAHAERQEWSQANARVSEAQALLPQSNFHLSSPLRDTFCRLFGRPSRPEP
jgi:serine/threonine protein kinase